MERFDGKYISVVTETGYACIGRMELVDGTLRVREEDLEVSLSQYRLRNAPTIGGIGIRENELLFLDEEDEIVINNEIVYMGVAACYEICWSRSSVRPWLGGFFP